MRNTHRELPWSIKEEILSEFSHKLMCSGYSERIRYEIISAAEVGYERQCDRADRGITLTTNTCELGDSIDWLTSSETDMDPCTMLSAKIDSLNIDLL